MAPGKGGPGLSLTLSLAAPSVGPLAPSVDYPAPTKTTLTRSLLERVERQRTPLGVLRGLACAGASDHQASRRARRDLPRRGPGAPRLQPGRASWCRTMLRDLSRTAKGREVLDRLAGVVLVGDPTANPRERITHLGGSRGTGILPVRIPTAPHTAQPRAGHGAVHRRRPGLQLDEEVPSGQAGTARPGASSWRATSATTSGSAATTPARRRSGSAGGWARSWTARAPPGPDLDDEHARPVVGQPVTHPCGRPVQPAGDRRGLRAGAGHHDLPAGVVGGVEPGPIGEQHPTPTGDDVVVGYTSTTVAPAVVRQRRFSLDSWGAADGAAPA